MHLVDTHLHLWDPAQFPYSWTKSIPALDRRFGLDDYTIAAAGQGITKAVFMECDVDEPYALAEAQHAQQLSESHPLIAGIVASARPESAQFEQQIRQLAELPKLKGIRRVLHTQPDGLSQCDEFARNIRLLARYGLTFDLCVLARQLPVAVSLVERCPEVAFVLDHCGVPDVKAGVLDPWKQSIDRLANFPNVSCKVSGLVAYATPHSWTLEDLRPWVEHVISAFGWSRLVWGGDWPVCLLGSSLARWVEATRALTASVSEAERAHFFHRNAERIYRV